MNKKNKKISNLFKKENKWIFIALFILLGIFMLYFMIEQIFVWSNMITQEQCDVQITTALLEDKADNYWQTLLAKNSQYIPLVVICIALAWLIHGVGFRIL